MTVATDETPVAPYNRDMVLPEFEQFPKPAGKNPYRVKGNAYRGHMEYVEEHVPGGAKAMREGFEDPALAEFFGQTFLAASFYDLYPLVAAGWVCAKLRGMSFSEFVRVRSEYQALRDVAGIYKMLLKLTSAEGLASRLPRLMAQYFDFAQAETHLIKPGHVVGEQKGVPRQQLAPWLATVCETYMRTVMPMAGARDLQVKVDSVRTSERRDGVELCNIRTDIIWSP
jgi:hypothetical protein